MSRIEELSLVNRQQGAATAVRVFHFSEHLDLSHASELFSNHYGIWGVGAPYSKIGRRIKASSSYLRKTYFFDRQCLYVEAREEEVLVGHAFARRFRIHVPKDLGGEEEYGNCLWITQLVIHNEFRKRGYARKLISTLIESSDIACGIVSSHPGAILALLRASSGIVFDLELIQAYAPSIMKASGIDYLENSNISYSKSGSLMLNANFFVDHTDIHTFIQGMGDNWQFGTDIQNGQEFVALVFPRHQKKQDLSILVVLHSQESRFKIVFSLLCLLFFMLLYGKHYKLGQQRTAKKKQKQIKGI